MPIDVFDLRDHVVDEYREYFESFARVRDPRINAHLQKRPT